MSSFPVPAEKKAKTWNQRNQSQPSQARSRIRLLCSSRSSRSGRSSCKKKEQQTFDQKAKETKNHPPSHVSQPSLDINVVMRTIDEIARVDQISVKGTVPTAHM